MDDKMSPDIALYDHIEKLIIHVETEKLKKLI